MFEDRDTRIDLLALALLAATIFLGLSLVSYDARDVVGEPVFPLNRIYQPDTLSDPARQTIGNWCGNSGALVADMLLRTLGCAAYFLVISMAAVSFILFTGREVSVPVVRTFGWFVALVGLSTLSSLLFSGRWSGPMIGPGGYVGTVSHALLDAHFATVGGLIMAISITLFGLILCTDYVLLRLGISILMVALRRPAIRIRRKRNIVANDVDEDGPLSVRIRGKRVDAHSQDDLPVEDEEEDEIWDEEEDDEGEELEDEATDDMEEEDEELEEEDEPAKPTPAAAAAGGLRRLMRKTPTLRVRKPPEKDSREEVMEQLDEASRQEETREYSMPSIDLLIEADDFSFDEQEKEVRRKAKILEKTFKDFGFQVKVVEIETGPVIAQYEVELEAGLRLSRITGLADDLAIALRVPSVRIVAPIPGKNTVGIEVPNSERQVVRLREVMQETNGRVSKMRIPLFLGKDVSGNPLTVDLSTLPHLLIAGRTGTGKSVCLNAIISSILMTRRPDEVRMLMIDPKMVELSGYKTLPHLMHPVVTDMRKAEAILAWAVDKMEERYELLARAGVRHISSYNQLGEEELMERVEPEDGERDSIPLHLPYIVIVADEMADLMMTAGKEVEQHIIRLAQKSRAVGIHLILATQKPTVDVITGLIKSNLPARIAFQVASRTDSRVVLDEMGADKLLGNGDMLFLWPGTSTLLRGQGTYLSDDEINAVVECVSTGEQNFVKELVQLKVEEPLAEGTKEIKKRDDLYESAVDIIIREGRGSVSLLQRCLGIGYGRAARLIDFMAEDGIVGPYNGSQAREILMSLEEWQQLQGSSAESETSTADDKPVKKRRSNKIIPMTEWDDAKQPDDDSSMRPNRVAPDRAVADNEEDEELDDQLDEELDEEFLAGEHTADEETDDEEADEGEIDDEHVDADHVGEEAESDDQAYEDEEYDEDDGEYDEVDGDDEYEGEEYDDEEYGDEEYEDDAAAAAAGDEDDDEHEDEELDEEYDDEYDEEYAAGDYDEADEYDDGDEPEYEAERAS